MAVSTIGMIKPIVLIEKSLFPTLKSFPGQYLREQIKQRKRKRKQLAKHVHVYMCVYTFVIFVFIVDNFTKRALLSNLFLNFIESFEVKILKLGFT